MSLFVVGSPLFVPMPEGLSLRIATSDDRARITKDWLVSYRDRSRCTADVYFREHRKIIDRLYPLVRVLHRAGTEIHGWICGEPGLIHFVCVPSELRRHGFARAMVAAVGGAGGEHTHRRMPGLSGFATWHLNPYKLGMADT